MIVSYMISYPFTDDRQKTIWWWFRKDDPALCCLACSARLGCVTFYSPRWVIQTKPNQTIDSISIRSFGFQKISIRSRFDLWGFKKSRFDLDSIFRFSKNFDSISIRSLGNEKISILSRFDLCAIKNFRFDLDSIRSFDLSIRSYNNAGFYWLGTEDSWYFLLDPDSIFYREKHLNRNL